jgi:hypothetical protein
MENGVAPETRSRGRRAAGGPRLAWFLAVAALLHTPLTPLGALVGLLAFLRIAPEEPPPEKLNAIPVSLLSPEEMAALGLGDEPPPPPAAAPDPAPPEPAAVPEPKPKPPKPKPKPKELPDGGVPESVDGGPREPKKSEKPAAALNGGDGGTPEGEPKKPAGGDPMALVGKAASVADPNANVKLLLLNERIRPLPIARRVGQLVARLPQWASFFGPAGLDPIKDIDKMYVAGPQFRSSAEVVAVLEYSVSRDAMKQAIDRIVTRPPAGEWYDEKFPVARARADRADRVFALPPGKTLVMVPPQLKDDVVAKAGKMRLPPVKGKAAVVAFIATPWRILLGLHAPADIPHSIASVSLSVEPREDGGAVIHVEAVDESPDAARTNATALTSAINLLTQRNVGGLGSLIFGSETLSLIEPVELHAEGKKIVGDAVVTPRQLSRILGFAEGWLDSLESRRAQPRQTAPSPTGTLAVPTATPAPTAPPAPPAPPAPTATSPAP